MCNTLKNYFHTGHCFKACYKQNLFTVSMPDNLETRQSPPKTSYQMSKKSSKNLAEKVSTKGQGSEWAITPNTSLIEAVRL